LELEWVFVFSDIVKWTQRIMKRITSIVFIVLSIVIFSFAKTKKSSKETDEFGLKVFQAIEQNDFELIKKMMVSKEDVESTLDHFEMDEARKSNVKKSLTAKITEDWELTMSTIEKGFYEIREVFESKKCKKDIIIHRIKRNTSVVHGLPFEIGELKIEFKCGKTVNAFNVEIIKTETGWYILEKLRLIHK